jgi:hypothetical protein
MAGGITLEQAQANLAGALEAIAAARLQQSYQVGSQSGARRVDRGAHESLLNEVKYWEQKVATLSRGGGLRTYYGVPCG